MRLINRPLTEDLRTRLRKISKSYSRFDSPWPNTLNLLDRECRHLLRPGVDEVVLMLDVSESMLRLDGGVKANARPFSDDVAIAVESKNGPLIFPCGEFTKWQDNVRAIALGMEALRKVDRYGISPSGEQYRGWQALPPGTPMPAAKMTVEEAERLLRDMSLWVGPIIGDDEIRSAYHRAAKLHHPDAGGDPTLFRKITEARDLLNSVR